MRNMTDDENSRASAIALATTLEEVRKDIVGQERLLERVLIALLANGHILIEGVPGLAKTKTVKAFSEALGGQWQRVQFTPDLVPSDLVGTKMWHPDTGTFTTELGPVNANFLLADEINRAPAKVQSALLEAMEERQVTIGRETFPLPQPFLVLATQNPVETEGTYALPEAQTDRFLMRVVVTYPQPADEVEILTRALTGTASVRQVMSPQQVADLQSRRRGVLVSPEITEAIVRLASLTRVPHADDSRLAGAVDLGAGVRGTIAMAACAQARAIIHGRTEVVFGDVADLAVDVLAHRIVLSYDALLAGVTQAEVVLSALERVQAEK